MITPTHSEKMEWSRMAQDAYLHGDNFTGHRYSVMSAIPTGARLDECVFDTLQRNYRVWLVGKAIA